MGGLGTLMFVMGWRHVSMGDKRGTEGRARHLRPRLNRHCLYRQRCSRHRCRHRLDHRCRNRVYRRSCRRLYRHCRSLYHAYLYHRCLMYRRCRTYRRHLYRGHL